MAKENEDDMSMEEILASIRQYVSTTTDKRIDKSAGTSQSSAQGKVVCLTKEMLDDNQQEEILVPHETTPKTEPIASKVSVKEALHKLRELKQTSKHENTSSTTDLSVAEFLSQTAKPLIQQWLDANLPELVAKVVREEISKIIDET